MKKVCLFFSVLMCVFMGSFSYAQQVVDDNAAPADAAPYAQNYDDSNAQYNNDGNCCPQEQNMGDCYCLYCKYEPCYYNKWRCDYCPKYTYKKCCRYVPQYYQKQCCRYVPQYYCVTCCRQCPQYYYTCQCQYCPKYTCEKCCRYVPRYYYKHVCCQQQQQCCPQPQQGCPCPQ